MSKDTNVDFTITFAKGKLGGLESSVDDQGCNGVEKLLKLYTTNSNTNMHLFNPKDKLHKYETVTEIIDDYFETRLELYQKRKDFMIAAIEKELLFLNNKSRYIGELLNDTIDLRKKKKDEVVQMLKSKNYAVIDEDVDYKYLTKLPMDSVTEENVDKITKECKSKQQELKTIKDTSIGAMWCKELDALSKVYLEYKENRERLLVSGDGPAEKKVLKAKKIKK